MCGDAPDSEPYCQWCCKPRRLCTCEKGKLAKEATRPHTPAPEHKPLVGFEFNPACDCSVCQDEKAAWEQRAARTATLAETAPIKQVYERFKHLDALLSKRDPDCPMMMCYVDIWEAVKDSIRRQRAGEQE